MSLMVMPIGAPTDPIFTPEDLADVMREFVTSGAYFANPQQTVICLPNGQCASKAESWTTPAYVAPPYVPVVHVPPPYMPPPQIATPEPGYGWCLAAFFVGVVIFTLLGLRKAKP